MKVIILIIGLLSLGINTAVSQIKADSINNKIIFNQGEYDYIINKDSVLSLYIDSVEHTTNLSNLPSFLFNSCFEANLPFIKPYHSRENFRWDFIRKVKSKRAIEIILSSKDVRLKAICKMKKSQFETVSIYNKYSFYDLFKIQYKALLNQ